MLLAWLVSKPSRASKIGGWHLQLKKRQLNQQVLISMLGGSHQILRQPQIRQLPWLTISDHLWPLKHKRIWRNQTGSLLLRQRPRPVIPSQIRLLTHSQRHRQRTHSAIHSLHQQQRQRPIPSLIHSHRRLLRHRTPSAIHLLHQQRQKQLTRLLFPILLQRLRILSVIRSLSQLKLQLLKTHSLIHLEI